MRKRLRPAHTPAQLAEIYATPHDHTQWADHVARVDATIAIARALADGPLERGADLSCGSAAVLNALAIAERHLGDFAPGYQYTGPIEETIEQIPDVDLFVCTETLEHLDDPDVVLKQVRAKTRLLVLSTPVDAWDDDNLEHYFAWSQSDVEEMLTAAGFTVAGYAELDFRPYGLVYSFGIWGCR